MKTFYNMKKLKHNSLGERKRRQLRLNYLLLLNKNKMSINAVEGNNHVGSYSNRNIAGLDTTFNS
jgi:hypothetical protein